MRVATIALLALPVIAGIASPAFACPLGSSTGPVSQLPCTVLKLACGGSTTTPPGGTTTGPVTTAPGTEPGTDPTSGNPTINNTTNNITNNITNNFFNGLTPEEIEAAKNGKPTTTTASTTPGFAFPASGAGGGVGGASGGGIGGGSFGGGSTVGGMPINPSSDLAFTPASGFTSSSSGGGIGFFSTTSSTLPSSGSGGGTTTTSGSFVIGAADAPAASPITPGVSLAALPAPKGGDDSYTIAMASPATAAAVSPAVMSSGFGLEGPASADAPMKAGVGGTPLLAGLLGLGVLGAGWAWRALVV